MDESQVDERVRKLSFSPFYNVKQFKGYYLNGFKFHIRSSNQHRLTSNNSLCVKDSVYDGEELDYYGTLVDIVELHYGFNSIVLFKCEWYDNTQSVRIIQPHAIVEVNHTTQLASSDVYVLAQQSQKVYYGSYSSKHRGREDWMVACKV